MGRAKKPTTTETKPPYSRRNNRIGVRTVLPLSDEGRTFFLEHVRRHPCLWDRKHLDFRPSADLNQVWTEIGRELYLHSYTDEQPPIAKLNITLTLLKSVYRQKKKIGSLTDELLASCSWLRTIDAFLSDKIDPYKNRQESVTSQTNFSLDETLQLLHFYKANDCLWNPKHPMYHNQNITPQIWKDMAAHINKNGLTAEHCKKMISQLRQRYFLKRDALRSVDVPEYCQTLEWFGLCESFLGPIIFPQGGQSEKIIGNNLKYSSFGLSVEESILDEELEPTGPVPSNLLKMNSTDRSVMYLRFLKLYQKFEILWNPKHPSYGLDFYRNRAWKLFAELIKIENITPEYCKEKMNTIRGSYIQKRRQLSAPELEPEMMCLQLAWFSLAESFLGPLLFSTDAERLREPLAKEKTKQEKDDDSKKHLPLQSKRATENSLHANDANDFELDEDSLPLSTFQVVTSKSCTDTCFQGDRKPKISDHIQNYLDDDIPHYTEWISLNDPQRLDEVRLRLVTLHKHFQLLWDKEHRSYNTNRLRHKAWRVFVQQAKIEGLTAEESKFQIRTIRKLHRDILQKKMNDELGGIKENFSQPKWFNVADSYLVPLGKVYNCSNIQSKDTKCEILKKFEAIPQYTETINLNDSSRLDEIRLRLMTLYKQYELLWNVNHKCYSATPVRSQTWKQFVLQAKIESLTIQELKDRIWSIRRSYKKIKLEVQTGKMVNRPPDWYYVADSFLVVPTGKVHNRINIQSNDTKCEILADTQNEVIPQYTETINLNDSSRLDEIRLRLMTLYKQYELLWNLNHKCYKATPVRQQTWKQFVLRAKIDSLTIQELKDQIWSIRRCYKKIKLDVQAGKLVKRQPDWYYLADSIFGPAMSGSSAAVKPGPRSRKTPNVEILPEFVAVTGTADDLQIKKEDLDFTTELTDTCCRACLQEHYEDQSFLKGLTTTIIDGVQLQQIYNECVGSAYEDVNRVLPDSICKSCFHLIIDFYQFRSKCLVNEMKFLVAKNVDLQKKTTEIAASCPTKPVNNTTQSAINEEEDDSFMNFADDDDSFTWEETPIVEHPKTVKEEPTTSTFNFGDLIKKEMPTTSKMSENLDKKIVEVRCYGKKRETQSKNAVTKKLKSTVGNEASSLEPITIIEVDENFTALNFDGEHLGFDNFFDDVCNESEPIDASSIVKHDKVITETSFTEVREKKEKKPAEQVEKEELMFADYLKKMLEKAKTNPCKIEKEPKLSHHKKRYRKKQVCSLCGITTINICKHMKTHKQAEKSHCNFCNRKQPFKHELQREEHLRRDHRDQLYTNKCKICDISFLTRQLRTEHMKTNHPVFKCDVCLKDFKTVCHMQVHRNSIHVIELNEDGTALQCSVCEKDFRNYTLLNQHRQRVHIQRKFDCDKCEYTAKQLRQLKRHQYAKHTDNVEKYICHICEKSFVHLHYLKNHFILKHIEDKKYKCHLCTESFKYNASLRTHLGMQHPEFQLPPKGETIIAI